MSNMLYISKHLTLILYFLMKQLYNYTLSQSTIFFLLKYCRLCCAIFILLAVNSVRASIPSYCIEPTALDTRKLFTNANKLDLDGLCVDREKMQG